MITTSIIKTKETLKNLHIPVLHIAMGSATLVDCQVGTILCDQGDINLHEGSEADRVRLSLSSLFVNNSRITRVEADLSRITMAKKSYIGKCYLKNSRMGATGLPSSIGLLHEVAPSSVSLPSTAVQECIPYNTLPKGLLTLYKFAHVCSPGSTRATGCAILTLQVPSDADRVMPIGSDKVRVSRASVVGCTLYRPEKHFHEPFYLSSNHDSDYCYNPGDIIKPEKEPFNSNPLMKCASGIHAFTSLKSLCDFLVDMYWISPQTSKNWKDATGESIIDFVERHFTECMHGLVWHIGKA